MAVIHPKQGGEYVPLDPADQTSATRAFSRASGSRGPAQTVGQPTHRMQTTQQQPAKRDFSRRLCLAVWHGGGWWEETVEMFEGFYSHDGLQDRSAYILATPMHPVPEWVMASARKAFVDVRVHVTNYCDPQQGVITPFALYEFAGLIGEKYGHQARILFTMPIRVVGPNSMTRLEQDAWNANPARGKDGQQQGKCILGAIRGEGPAKAPFSTFVALPTWTREPNFSLVKKLDKMPITSVENTPMRFMRFEMMKNMAVSPLINPDPDVMPSDPRWTLLEGRALGQRFKPVQPVETPNPAPIALPEPPAPFDPNPVLEPPPAHAFIPDAPIPEPAATGLLPLPGELEIESRIALEGLDWLKDYACPTDIPTIKLIHNAEIQRRKRAAEGEPIADTQPEAPPVKAAKVKKPAKAKKGALSGAGV